MARDVIVAYSVGNQERNRCVDIIQELSGAYRYQEWRREPEDISGWFLMFDCSPKTYPSVEQAIAAAKQAVVWYARL